jgi:hypothetical protein
MYSIPLRTKPVTAIPASVASSKTVATGPKDHKDRHDLFAGTGGVREPGQAGLYDALQGMRAMPLRPAA